MSQIEQEAVDPQAVPLAAPAPPDAVAPVPPSTTDAGVSSKAIGEQVKAMSLDALGAFRTFIASPVGGLPIAFERLGKPAAMKTGIAFAVVVSIALAFAAKTIYRANGVSSVVFGGLLFAGLAGASFIARKLFRGDRGSVEGDIFISGAALLPVAALMIVGALVGAQNFEVVGLLSVAVLVYCVLIVYSGCTRISGIPEGLAAPAVAVMFLLAAWLTKVLFFSTR